MMTIFDDDDAYDDDDDDDYHVMMLDDDDDIIGNALKEESRLDEAINAYRAALHLKADHPHAYNNLGGTR